MVVTSEQNTSILSLIISNALLYLWTYSLSKISSSSAPHHHLERRETYGNVWVNLVLAKRRHLPKHKSCDLQLASLVRKAFRFLVRGLDRQRIDPSFSPSRLYPLGKEYIDRMTRACRTVLLSMWRWGGNDERVIEGGVSFLNLGQISMKSVSWKAYFGESSDGTNDISLLVHDDDSSSSQSRLKVTKWIEIHAIKIQVGIFSSVSSIRSIKRGGSERNVQSSLAITLW